jgi:membrane protein YdbS with pleckstrin-like domain
MEDKILLKRSSKGLQAQIIATGIAAVLIALLATWLISKLFGWTPNEGSFLKALTWIILIGAWAVMSLKLWFEWNIKRYEIAKDALIVHAKAGKFGTSQTVYRYESIISIRMTQGFLGKRFGYGDVRLTIPKLDGEVVMNDIENPVEQLAEVQKRMGERSGGTHSLIN